MERRKRRGCENGKIRACHQNCRVRQHDPGCPCAGLHPAKPWLYHQQHRKRLGSQALLPGPARGHPHGDRQRPAQAHAEDRGHGGRAARGRSCEPMGAFAGGHFRRGLGPVDAGDPGGLLQDLPESRCEIRNGKKSPGGGAGPAGAPLRLLLPRHQMSPRHGAHPPIQRPLLPGGQQAQSPGPPGQDRRAGSGGTPISHPYQRVRRAGQRSPSGLRGLCQGGPSGLPAPRKPNGRGPGGAGAWDRCAAWPGPAGLSARASGPAAPAERGLCPGDRPALPP